MISFADYKLALSASASTAWSRRNECSAAAKTIGVPPVRLHPVPRRARYLRRRAEDTFPRNNAGLGAGWGALGAARNGVGLARGTRVGFCGST